MKETEANYFDYTGEFQDGFEKEIVFGFHSLISSSLNIGLLNPEEVVEAVINYYENHELEIASVEGFIRQIIGWREYVRALYQLESEKMKESNFFQQLYTKNEPLSKKDWTEIWGRRLSFKIVI